LQLFQSDKMASLGRLAAGVAHEINNPLTGVLTYSSFLLKRAKDNPELRDDLNVIVREATRSREIVKSLLDFARQSVPKKNRIDIREVIDRSIAVVDNQLSINRVRLTTRFEDGLPRILADSNQLQQVFINLLSNAAEAMQADGGTITISTSLIHVSPAGIVQVKKALCPKGHSLIDNEVKIGGRPSIKVKATSGGKEGLVYLDPIYGKNRHEYELEVDSDDSVLFACPICNRTLMDEGRQCPKCGSRVFSIEVPGQGNLKGCTRKVCDWQQWKHVDQAGQRSYVEVKVADTGCGIARDDLTRIFDPFFTTKGQKGTGLGLAVSWGIIDNHDGTIRVDSQPGKGTLFTICLPAEEKEGGGEQAV
ncbi:MAG: ATP-binding protein, partial [Saprospiraceae bacterium]|nr:ATP-binding protein [Saprospiraceae bacterium]